jgi:hypothetical protein
MDRIRRWLYHLVLVGVALTVAFQCIFAILEDPTFTPNKLVAPFELTNLVGVICLGYFALTVVFVGTRLLELCAMFFYLIDCGGPDKPVKNFPWQ